MTDPTTPAEAVAQWCEENGWTKNPECIPAGTHYVRIHKGEVQFDGVLPVIKRRGEMPEHRVIYADLPKPVLPTERGDLIVDVTDIDGDHYNHLQFDGSCWSGCTDDGEWFSSIDPDVIVSWHPGKSVRADA